MAAKKHIVRPGETINKIAARYGVAGSSIFAWNRGRNFSGRTFNNINLIYPGWDLYVSNPAANVTKITPVTKPNPATGSDKTMLLLLGAGALALFFISKSGKKGRRK